MTENSVVPTIRDDLCSICLDTYEKRLSEARFSEERNTGRQSRDIYQMEREALEQEANIHESLSPERRNACWDLVKSVQESAESRVRDERVDYGEQGMLYNILISKAWEAAQSYNPVKSKFSTWLKLPWKYAISDFRRAKRLETESLSNSRGDPESQTTLEDQIEDVDLIHPHDILAGSQLLDWHASLLETQPLVKLMIDDVYEQYEWLCPLCRRVLRKKALYQIDNTRDVDIVSQIPKHDVYARRRSWRRQSAK